MRAIAIEEFGSADVLRPMNLPRPAPGKGEVLIHVVAAGVNRVDCLIREGRLQARFEHKFPIIPGWDAAGVVEELGEGTGRLRKGDRVWAMAMKPTIHAGCYAEYVAVPENQVALMPAKLLFEEAAAVPVAALAAQQALTLRPGIGKDTTVLIHGASGGVGHYAVQLAKLFGAQVIGTAGTANQPFLLELGADAGIDYTKEDVVEATRRRHPDGVDLILDTVGGETLGRSYALLKRGGHLVSLVDEPDAEAAAARGARADAHVVRPDGEQLHHFASLVDHRKLKPHVQRIYALRDAAVAHRIVEDGHVRGKLVLNL